MTLEELLQAAGLAGGGTSPDATISPRGYRPPTPSLGLGTDPTTGYTRGIGGAPVEPVVEPPLRLPGPGGMPDRPGHSSFWERLGTASGGLPALPYHTGEGPGDNDRSSPWALLYNLAAGYANGRSKLAGADKLERLTFADNQQKQVDARKLERDQTFARARTLAETVRKEKAEREAKRVDQMTTARRDYEGKLDAWMHIVNTATTQEQLDDAKRQANKYQSAIEKIDRDMMTVGGQQRLEAAGVDTSAGIPGMPSQPPKPAKAEGEAAGGYDVFMTPDGPKMMTRAEGTKLGLLPSDIRKKRAASPSEREGLALQSGFQGTINSIKEKYAPAFTGTVKGAAFGISPTGISERVGFIPREESSFRSMVDGLKNEVLKLRAGSAVTESEAQRLLDELPTYDLPPKVFEERMDNFERRFRRAAEAQRMNIDASDIDISKFAPLPGAIGWPHRTRKPAPKGKKGKRPNPNAPPERRPITDFDIPDSTGVQ